MPTDADIHWMRYAIGLAQRADAQGEVPVGAVVVSDGEMLGEGWNCPISGHDPAAHAEIVAMRAAGRALGNYRLSDTTLYVTLEPCVMCVGAIVHARVARVVFGASDPKAGAVGGALDLSQAPHFNHVPEFSAGLLATECADLLRDFFRRRRQASSS